VCDPEQRTDEFYPACWAVNGTVTVFLPLLPLGEGGRGDEGELISMQILIQYLLEFDDPFEVGETGQVSATGKDSLANLNSS
jgi:hypothetical protein